MVLLSRMRGPGKEEAALSRRGDRPARVDRAKQVASLRPSAGAPCKQSWGEGAVERVPQIAQSVLTSEFGSSDAAMLEAVAGESGSASCRVPARFTPRVFEKRIDQALPCVCAGALLSRLMVQCGWSPGSEPFGAESRPVNIGPVKGNRFPPASAPVQRAHLPPSFSRQLFVCAPCMVSVRDFPRNARCFPCDRSYAIHRVRLPHAQRTALRERRDFPCTFVRGLSPKPRPQRAPERKGTECARAGSSPIAGLCVCRFDARFFRH